MSMAGPWWTVEHHSNEANDPSVSTLSTPCMTDRCPSHLILTWISHHRPLSSATWIWVPLKQYTHRPPSPTVITNHTTHITVSPSIMALVSLPTLLSDQFRSQAHQKFRLLSDPLYPKHLQGLQAEKQTRKLPLLPRVPKG